MPELLKTGRERRLVPGDVLMVARKMHDKQTRRPFEWRFFLVVTRHKRGRVAGMVVGTEHERLKDEELVVAFSDEKNVIQFLPMDEWPDGVHAFRLAMVLKGQIEDVV